MDSAKLGHYIVWFDNGKEYHVLKREIFSEHCYYLELPDTSPRILDIGAHIGLTTLYFKRLFPNSTITAYEPHPESFRLLSRNVELNELKGVTLYALAVNTSSDPLILHAETDQDAWRSTLSFHAGAWNDSQPTAPITFPGVALSEVLFLPYDVVKIDVEGFEFELVNSAKAKLRQGKHWLIEVHGSHLYDPANLISLFQDHGFVTRLEQHGTTVKPYKFKGLAMFHADMI
jgi:FkbM family methyltransferase